MHTRRSRRGPTLRAVLFAGFGLTLGIWLLVGYQLSARIARMQRVATTIDQRYSNAQGQLATVRRQVLQAAVYVRDALLDANRHGPADYGVQIDAACRAAIDALGHYVPVVDDSAEESERVHRLRDEVAQFQRVAQHVLEGNGVPSAMEARAVLRRQIVPKRDVVLGISEDLQALNRDSFIEQRKADAALYAVTQRQVWRQLGLAMAGGLLIALVATLYASNLERRLRIQRDQQLENARDLQRLSARVIRVQEEERRAIARELHDEVGQVLTAIKVELATAQRAIDTAGGDPRLLQNTRTIADSALHTVKDLSRLLHPAVLDDLGLSLALDGYLREFGRRHGLKVEFSQEHMDDRLPPAVEIAVYRVVQEALTNSARHARATACAVRLRRWPEVLVVTVEDDGTGFDPQRNGESRGLGLIGIRERIADVGGHLRIESAPGRGTRIVLDLPAESLPPVEFAFDAEPVPRLDTVEHHA